ncbi:DUF551 domain-containing protein [Salmonella enterica]
MLVATGATYSRFEDFWSSCKHPFAQDDELKDISWVIWNACRAAMLQSKYRDLSQPVDPQISEYEKIMLQAGHSPVTPKGYRLQPLVEYDAMCAVINSDEWPRQWIPCSERLPDKDQHVLVFVDFDSPTVKPIMKDAEYTGNTFRIGPNTVNTDGLPKVTHWQPLPAAPQQEMK